MLSEYINQNEQAALIKPKTLTLRVSCKSDLIEKLNTALDFVSKKMGFQLPGGLTFSDGTNTHTLINPNGNKLLLDVHIIPNGTDTIIFYTDDCLRDYHKYLISGVEFLNRPEYTAAGLQVKFMDHQNNYYTLLEERTYNES